MKNELGVLRATMRRFAESDVVDTVVIGTGAGGAPVLAQLAAAGRSVVALEAGAWFESPWDEFPTDDLQPAPIYWDGERLSAGNTPEVFGANTSGSGVGGSMLHWGAFTPRADESQLTLKTQTGEGVDWPITLAELQPYYVHVEEFLGVSGPENYIWDPSRRYPTGPVAINAPGQLMLKGYKAIGMRASAAPIAALSTSYKRPEYAERPACVNRGYCHQGCRNGAKATTDVTYLPWAVRSGAEIRARAMVTGFERDAAGQIVAVVYTDRSDPAKPVERRQRCRAVVLAAGAIETPRLLLHTGLANSSGQVGRNYMAHVATQVWGTFDEPVRMNRGFPATVISEDTIQPQSASFPHGYLVQSLGVVPASFAQSVARGRGLFGEALKRYLADYNYVAGIGVNGDCLPSEGNFVELSDEVDSTGMRKPRVHFSYGEHETAQSAHGVKIMRAAWEAAGARDIWECPRVAHTIGTARMGMDAGTSVVDPYGQSHEIANLWISDNSTFPSALAANPALTIMALAHRTAERMLRAS